MSLIMLSSAKAAGFSTYAQFEAWANSQTATDIDAFSTYLAIAPDGALLRVLNNGMNTGDMYGSPHGVLFHQAYTAPSRMLQHSYPNQAAYNAAGGQISLMRVTRGVDERKDWLSVSRNGYTSLSLTHSAWGLYGEKFVYWDPLLNKAMQRSPRLGDSGAGLPTEFNGVL